MGFKKLLATKIDNYNGIDGSKSKLIDSKNLMDQYGTAEMTPTSCSHDLQNAFHLTTPVNNEDEEMTRPKAFIADLETINQKNYLKININIYTMEIYRKHVVQLNLVNKLVSYRPTELPTLTHDHVKLYIFSAINSS